MSMERHVFFRGKLPSKAALARAMKELGFAFSIKPATGPLEQQSGFMPMLLRGEETGIEFDVFDGRSTIDEFETGEVDQSFDRCANFRWGGDETEMLVALCASAALAKLTGGIVFDEEEGKLLCLDEAIDAAAKEFALQIKPAAAKLPGTRHADVKRYVKPLVARCSDLVLIKRGPVLIRPVRHLLRGVFFEREDKFQFKVWRYLRPLYSKMRFDVGLSSRIPKISPVWQPHFVPELLDRLDFQIFASVGSIIDLAGFASDIPLTMERHFSLDRPDYAEQRVVALVLADEREQAVEFVNQMEQNVPDRPTWVAWAKEQRAFLSRDIASICEECHAREERVAKLLRLDGVWEPSPFPVEVPAAERAARTNEPSFATTPWVPRPDWLWGDEPETPGEVRFAKDFEIRDGRAILLVPLTRENAQEMHRTYQEYVLATRLTNGGLLVLRRLTGWSPYNPAQAQNVNYVPTVKIYLELHKSSQFVETWFAESRDQRDFMELLTVEVRSNDTKGSAWRCSFLPSGENSKSVHDDRGEKGVHVKTEQTAEERDLIFFPMPQFGDFTELLRRTNVILRTGGYEEVI